MNATSAQIAYMEILFQDLGFARTARNAYLKSKLGRPIIFLDQLTIPEASRIITGLEKRKEDAS